MLQAKSWALITGAQGGIGQALVKEFVGKGFNVIAADIIKDSQTFAAYDNVISLVLDLECFVNDEGYAKKIHQQVQKITESTGITVLINNAAVQILARTEDFTRQQWLRSFNVNLHAPFFLVQTFLSSLKKNSGSVVNISSIHATQTKQEFVAYATTKAAISSLTKNLALDIGADVRVNAIEPAAISTDMLLAGFEGREEAYKDLELFHPMGRIGTPEEIAKLAYFLASDEAGFLHGACISASGGIQGCLSDPK